MIEYMVLGACIGWIISLIEYKLLPIRHDFIKSKISKNQRITIIDVGDMNAKEIDYIINEWRDKNHEK